MRKTVVVDNSKESFFREVSIVEVDCFCDLNVESLWLGELMFIGWIEGDDSNKSTSEKGECWR